MATRDEADLRHDLADLGTPPVTVYGDGSPFSFVLAPEWHPPRRGRGTLDNRLS